MANYNKVILLGNLTRDIEMRYTPSNLAIAKMGLAVNRRFRTQDGENREETTFVDCEAFGRQAEVMNQYLSKGRPVLIEGRLRLDQWEDKQSGQNRSKLLVVVENFQFVGGRGEDGGGSGGGGGGGGYRSSGGSQQRSAPAQQSQGDYEPIDEDDIPF
jgi:single-strand DNA-binding protein